MFDPIENKQIGSPKLSENYWRDKKAENPSINIDIYNTNIIASLEDISIFKHKT